MIALCGGQDSIVEGNHADETPDRPPTLRESLPPIVADSTPEDTRDDGHMEAVPRQTTRSTSASGAQDHPRDASGATALTVATGGCGDDEAEDGKSGEYTPTIGEVTALMGTNMRHDAERNEGESPSRFSHKSAEVKPLLGGYENGTGDDNDVVEDKTEVHHQGGNYNPEGEQPDVVSGTMTAMTTGSTKDVKRFCPEFTAEFAQQIKDCRKLVDGLVDPEETARVLKVLENKPNFHADTTSLEYLPAGNPIKKSLPAIPRGLFGPEQFLYGDEAPSINAHTNNTAREDENHYVVTM